MIVRRPILALALAAVAAVSAAQTNPTIGYVDIDQVVSKSRPIRRMIETIQDQLSSLQEQIEVKRKQITDLESEIRRSDGVLKPDAIEAKRKEVLRLRNEFDDLDFQARQKAREIDATVFEPALKRVVFAIQEVAREKSIDLVLRGEAVLYGSSRVDLTDLVVAKLDQTGGMPSTEGRPTPAPAGDQAGATAIPEATPASTPAATAAASPTPAADEPPADGSRVIDLNGRLIQPFTSPRQFQADPTPAGESTN